MIDLKTLKTLPGSEVMALTIEALNQRAEVIRQSQDAMVAACMQTVWSPPFLSSYAALRAASDAIDRIRQLGSDAKSRGEKAPAMVVMIADILRSTLIIEMQLREPAIPSEANHD